MVSCRVDVKSWIVCNVVVNAEKEFLGNVPPGGLEWGSVIIDLAALTTAMQRNSSFLSTRKTGLDCKIV